MDREQMGTKLLAEIDPRELAVRIMCAVCSIKTPDGLTDIEAFHKMDHLDQVDMMRGAVAALEFMRGVFARAKVVQ